MIKKLSFKFVLVFLVLVVSVFITSTCYAVLGSTVETSPFTKEDIYNGSVFKSVCSSNGLDLNENNSKVLAFKNFNSSSSSTDYYALVLHTNYEEIAYVGYNSSGKSGCFYDINGNIVTANYLGGYIYSSGDFVGSWSLSNVSNAGIIFTESARVLDISDYIVKIGENIIYSPLSVDVIHEFQNDTSAKVNFVVNGAPEGAYLQYSLTGVELNTDLTAPIKLRNPITYISRSNKFSCKGKYKSILGVI